MSTSTFFISASALRTLKQTAKRSVPSVSSSHLSEGIAVALGFRTHAALRAAFTGRTTVEVQKPDNTRLMGRLRQLGYVVPESFQVVPEFKHSYLPFRDAPLRKRHGTRWYAWRNLLVAAINAGLEQRLFGLCPSENWWPGGVPESDACQRGIYHFWVDREIKAIASVNAARGDELSICVILNPRKADIQPEWYRGLNDGDAVAHCWLERRFGAWIQDGGDAFRCRRSVQPHLANLVIEPNGYSDRGSFFI